MWLPTWGSLQETNFVVSLVVNFAGFFFLRFQSNDPFYTMNSRSSDHKNGLLEFLDMSLTPDPT